MGGIFLTIGKVLGTLLLVGVTTGAILACFAAVYIKTVILPQSDVNVAGYNLNLSSTIYYTDPETGQDKELRTLHGGENRVWVKYEEIPLNLVHAAVAIEDERFYSHHGVDWKRTIGAFVNMFLGMKDNFGGSTLTQQLIKNITDQDDVTVQRKIMEIFRALAFEEKHTKEEILEWYLNYIYLGESSYGVYTASYTYFGKHVSQLSLAECASLVSITNNPSMYDPYISENTRNNNKNRQTLVLGKMLELDFITQAEYDAALAEELNFQRGEDDSRPVAVYSWYEDQIIRDVIADLKLRMGISENAASMMLYSGGLSVYSCYNPKVQAVVDEIYENTENLPYKSATGQNMQSGIAIIDSVTGNVVALSGGLGPKTESLSFSRASGAKRPPGSSIKPLAVYAPALELEMITPATVVDDSPYSRESSGAWPVNSFGYYNGLTTVYEALQNSVNTVAVKIMANYLTPEVAFDFVTERFGLSLEPGRMINGQQFTDKAVAPLALGGLTDGVSPLQMASAFSTFPRNGTYVAPRTYTKVVDSDGVTVLIDNQPQERVAIKESTAWYITYMLKNAVKNGTGTRANFSGMEIAGKTGTTSARKDLWFVGYTPYYTAAVWTGFDEQERMGSSLQQTATGMWNKVMSKLHEGLEYKDFTTPETVRVTSSEFCKDSGMLPTDACRADPRGRVTSGKFVAGDEPSQFCEVHTTIEVCTESPLRNAEGNPSGLWHLAGPYCPEETKKSISVVDYTREDAALLATTRDFMYMKSYYDNMGDAAYCTVHTTEPVPEPTPPTFENIDPMDPATWPDLTEYPNFNPFDQTTWPGYTPPSSHPPEVSPTVTPEVPTPGPDLDEPFIPADGPQT